MSKIFKNRKVYYNYELLETFTAGLVLKGDEVKSLMNGEASINDSFCIIKNGEIFLIKHILTVREESFCESNRALKLLLNKREITKLGDKVKDKGLSIVPIELFRNEKGLFKLKIALARGKKNYDKRESLKIKDLKREVSRQVNSR